MPDFLRNNGKSASRFTCPCRFDRSVQGKKINGLYNIIDNIQRFPAKKDEVERNNERVQNVLSKVTYIANNLGKASNVLVGSSQTESAATQELSAISETLLATSCGMMEKSEQSKD